MPTFKQAPASIRYLKARLNILKRPRVWATASGLILSVFLVGEYLANPQKYTSGNDPGVATNPSNQNPLGNLPTQNTPASSSELFETLPEISTVQTQTSPTQTSSDPQSPQIGSSRYPLLQEFLLSRSSGTAPKDKPGRSQSSSFSTSSSAATRRDRTPESRLPSLYPLDSPSGLSGATATSRQSASFSNGFTAINPLQSALDRYSSIGSQSQPSSAPSPTQSSAEQGFGASRLSATENSIRQDSGRQQETSPQGFPSPQFAPQLSPAPGTTGYTLPSTLRTSTPNIRPYSSNGSFQPIPGQVTPQTAPAVPGQSYDYGQPSYAGAAQTTVVPIAQPSFAPSFQPMPAPFSVPRAAPGRSIGGGQINTFSNP